MTKFIPNCSWYSEHHHDEMVRSAFIIQVNGWGNQEVMMQICMHSIKVIGHGRGRWDAILLNFWSPAFSLLLSNHSRGRTVLISHCDKEGDKCFAIILVFMIEMSIISKNSQLPVQGSGSNDTSYWWWWPFYNCRRMYVVTWPEIMPWSSQVRYVTLLNEQPPAFRVWK